MGMFESWLKIQDKHCQIKKKTAKHTWEKTSEREEEYFVSLLQAFAKKKFFFNCFIYPWHMILIDMNWSYSLFIIHRQLQLWQINSSLTGIFFTLF